MTLSSTKAEIETYSAEVRNFASFKPEFSENNKHNTDIPWSEILTDGLGNVLDMPYLPTKRCFGRIEYSLRHHADKPDRKKIKGSLKERHSRCSRCHLKTPNTAKSCGLLVRERILESDQIRQAVIEWDAEVQKEKASTSNPRARIHEDKTAMYVGKLSAAWGNVRDAVINEGPFADSNNQKRLKVEADRKRRNLEADTKRKGRERREARKQAQKKLQIPPQQFQDAAWREAILRQNQLKAARNVNGMPVSIKRMTDFGCEMAALSWYYKIICEQMGKPVKAGSMAQWLCDTQLNSGRSYATLNARLGGDIAKAHDIETCRYGTIWVPFDPDSDLESYAMMDDDSEASISDEVNGQAENEELSLFELLQQSTD